MFFQLICFFAVLVLFLRLRPLPRLTIARWTPRLEDLDDLLEEIVFPMLAYCLVLPVYFGALLIHTAARSPSVHRFLTVSAILSWWTLCPASLLDMCFSPQAIVWMYFFLIAFAILAQEVTREEIIACPPSLTILQYRAVEFLGWCLLRRKVQQFEFEYPELEMDDLVDSFENLHLI